MATIRRLLSVLSALSLLLLLIALLLCGRSYIVCDLFTTQFRGVQQMWRSDAGRIYFGRFTVAPDNGYDHPWTWNTNSMPGLHAPLAGGFWKYQHFGVGWDVRGSAFFTDGGVRYQQSAHEWWVAYWLIVLLSLPLAMIVILRIARWTTLKVRRALERRRDTARGFPLDPPLQNATSARGQ